MKCILPITALSLLFSHSSFAAEDPVVFNCNSIYSSSLKEDANVGRGEGTINSLLQRSSTHPKFTPQIHNFFEFHDNQYLQSSITLDDSKKDNDIYKITLKLKDLTNGKVSSKSHTYKGERASEESFKIKMKVDSLNAVISFSTHCFRM
ncbi:MAG: hypothetical protein ACRBBP_03560 [Bdellovibrionales bacterium]